MARSTITKFIVDFNQSNCNSNSVVGYNGLDTTVNQNDTSLNLFLLTQINLPNSTGLFTENEEQRAGFYIDQCSYINKGIDIIKF